MKHLITLIFAVTCTLFSSLWADVELAPIFSNNMVLQREVSIPLRGTASKDSVIKIRFNGKELTAKVSNLRWKVDLPPMPAGGSYDIVVKGSQNSLTLKNVTFGDICRLFGRA